MVEKVSLNGQKKKKKKNKQTNKQTKAETRFAARRRRKTRKPNVSLKLIMYVSQDTRTRTRTSVTMTCCHLTLFVASKSLSIPKSIFKGKTNAVSSTQTLLRHAHSIFLFPSLPLENVTTNDSPTQDEQSSPRRNRVGNPSKATREITPEIQVRLQILVPLHSHPQFHQ